MNTSKHRTTILALTLAARHAAVDQIRDTGFEEGRMLQSQERKYGIRDDSIVNRRTGEPIPDDEPVLVLRAKDRLVIRALTPYFSAVEDPSLHKRSRLASRISGASPKSILRGCRIAPGTETV